MVRRLCLLVLPVKQLTKLLLSLLLILHVGNLHDDIAVAVVSDGFLGFVLREHGRVV